MTGIEFLMEHNDFDLNNNVFDSFPEYLIHKALFHTHYYQDTGIRRIVIRSLSAYKILFLNFSISFDNLTITNHRFQLSP